MPEVVLPVDARSVAAARTLLRAAMQGYPTPSADDAVLMISELVTNAVRHAHALVRVTVSITAQTLHVEVSDDEPALPVAPAPEDHATNGRGLRIIDALADHWGVTPDGLGKSVWFDIHLGRPSPVVP